MKTVLLNAAFLVMGLSTVHAQTSVLVSDTSIVEGRRSSSVLNTYDSACRQASSTTTYYDQNGQPDAASRDLNEYYPDGSLYRTTSQSRSHATDTFTNFIRITNTYTSAGELATEMTETYPNGQWVPDDLFSYTYNATGYITYELDRRWHPNINGYVNNYDNTYTYNSLGSELTTISRLYDTTNAVWVVQLQSFNVYDAHNYLTSDTVRNYDNSTKMLMLNFYQQYYNNSFGEPDSVIVTNVYPIASTEKSSYVYFADSVTVQQETDLTYQNGSDTPVFGSRDLFFYDSSANTKMSSNDYYDLDASTGTYTFISGNYRTETFNADGSLQRFEDGSKTYDSNNIPQYSPFIVTNYQYAPCVALLPVSLLSFTATRQGSDAVLQWKTANEINASSFGVERSVDGSHFTLIGTVRAGAAGGSYRYTDAGIDRLGTATVYYRLAQQDVNGSVRNSAVARITLTGGNLTVVISPNPVRDHMTVYSSAAMPDAVIRVADVNGRVLTVLHANLPANGTAGINVSALAKGMYFVTVTSDKTVHTFRVMKE